MLGRQKRTLKLRNILYGRKIKLCLGNAMHVRSVITVQATVRSQKKSQAETAGIAQKPMDPDLTIGDPLKLAAAQLIHAVAEDHTFDGGTESPGRAGTNY